MNRTTLEQKKMDILIDYFCTQSDTPIVIVDNDYKISSYNSALQNIFIDNGDLEGKNLDEIVAISEMNDLNSEFLSYNIKRINGESKHPSGSDVLQSGFMISEDDYKIIIFEKNLPTEPAIQTQNTIIDMASLERELRKKNAELEKANEEILKLSITDYLTGAYNRRYFFERLREAIALKDRYTYPQIGVIMADIDFFRIFNDTYGHEAGDMVLKSFVTELNKVLRKEDILARIGGEEFCIFVRIHEEMGNIFKVAEKLRQTMVNIKIDNILEQITASFGATVFVEGETADSIIKRADHALIQAKETGRNKVVVM